MSEKSLGLFKLATGCIAISFCGLRKALPFTGILALAITGSSLAGALPFASIATDTLPLRRLSGRVRGGRDSRRTTRMGCYGFGERVF